MELNRLCQGVTFNICLRGVDVSYSRHHYHTHGTDTEELQSSPKKQTTGRCNCKNHCMHCSVLIQNFLSFSVTNHHLLPNTHAPSSPHHQHPHGPPHHPPRCLLRPTAWLKTHWPHIRQEFPSIRLLPKLHQQPTASMLNITTRGPIPRVLGWLLLQLISTKVSWGK